MKIKKEKIVETARRYLGWKYQEQGRDEYGIDCGGLIILVCRELGATKMEFLGYSGAPDGETFERLLAADLNEITPKENAQIGDILACDYKLPKFTGISHTAFVTAVEPRLTVIHAKRERGVIETFIHGADLRAWSKTYRIRGAK